MLTLPVLLLGLLQAPQSESQIERLYPLMLGDRAPRIEVAEWVQGEPVQAFEPGHLYVVEFWATWCGPCKKAIPHLNELAHEYDGKVRFIGVSISETISDEEPYRVPEFVKEMGDQMTYTVASDRAKAEDPHRMREDWMRAAGQGGIPTAFIVNGEGRVAWIGSPFVIDEPLSQIVAGTWDIEKAARDYAAEMRSKALTDQLAREISKAKKNRDWASALKTLDDGLRKAPELEANFGIDRYFLLLDLERQSEAATYGRHLVADVIAKNPYALNQLAWSIVDPQAKREGGDYVLAVLAAERAVELQEGKDASVLDTLGLALFRVGKVARAIEIQTRAVELAKGTRLEEELSSRLEEFRRAQQEL